MKNRPVSVVSNLKVALSGRMPDVEVGSPFELPDDYIPIATVPEDSREIFSRAHWFLEKSIGSTTSLFEQLKRDHGITMETFEGFDQVLGNKATASVLGEIAGIGIACQVHKVREFFGSPGIFKNWVVAVPKKHSFPLGKMYLEPNHVAVSFFDNLVSILKGKCLFDGKNNLNNIAPEEKQVGVIDDEVLKQAIFLRSKMYSILIKIDPHKDFEDEICAFRDRSVIEYACFKSATSLIRRSVSLTNSILMAAIPDIIEPSVLLEAGADISELQVRSNWELVIPKS